RVPSLPAVEGAVEGDDVLHVVVPRDVEFAAGADRGRRADGAARPGRVVGARDVEGRAVICGRADADAAARRAAGGRVPRDVDVVAEAARGATVGRYHRLVVEMVLAAV